MDVDEVCSVIAASAPTTDHRASALTTVLQFTHATRRSDMSRRLSLMGQAGRAAAVANGTDYTFTTEDCQNGGRNGPPNYTLTTEDCRNGGRNGRAAAVANGTDYTLTTEDCQRNRGVRKKRTKKFHTGRAQSGTTRSGGGRYGDCGNVDRGCIRSANGKVEGLCRGPCKDAHGNVLSRVSDVPAIFIAAT
jgi:hypothetical protein